ncbi:MAG: TonB-dependent receptor domain-containing protein, partial [Rhodanobacter sp.]
MGLVHSPSYVDGLDMSLDWYRIRITNSISQPDATVVLNQCYVQQNAEFCDKVVRSTNPLSQGQVLRADETVANLGTTDVEGYDFTTHYRFPETSFGTFRANLDSTYLVKYDTKVTPEQVTLGNVGFGDVFRFRANTGLDWSYGDFGATWNMRYQSGAKFDCQAPDFNSPSDPGEHCNMPDYVSPLNGVQPLQRIGSFTYHDVQFRWSAPWNGTVSLGANNVFNKKPISNYDSTRTFQPYYDIPGVYYYVRYNQKF